MPRQFCQVAAFSFLHELALKGCNIFESEKEHQDSQSGCSVITCNYLSLHGHSSFLIVVGSDQMLLMLTRFATRCSLAVVIFCRQNLDCDQAGNILVTLSSSAFCYKDCCLAGERRDSDVLSRPGHE